MDSPTIKQEETDTHPKRMRLQPGDDGFASLSVVPRGPTFSPEQLENLHQEELLRAFLDSPKASGANNS